MFPKTWFFGICDSSWKHSFPCTLWIQTKMLMAGQSCGNAMQYYILTTQHSISFTGWAVTWLGISCLLTCFWGDTNKQWGVQNELAFKWCQTYAITESNRSGTTRREPAPSSAQEQTEQAELSEECIKQFLSMEVQDTHFQGDSGCTYLACKKKLGSLQKLSRQTYDCFGVKTLLLRKSSTQARR